MCALKLPKGCTLPDAPDGYKWRILGYGAKRPKGACPIINAWNSFSKEWGKSGSNWQGGDTDWFYIHAAKLPAKKQAQKAVVLPDGAPKLPPVPRGYSRWGSAFRGSTKNLCNGKMCTVWVPSEKRWRKPDTVWAGALESNWHCLAIKSASTKKASPTTRREPRVSRVATIIQRAKNGEFATAHEAAREVEKLIDNAMRKKRHAKAKKPVKKSAWRILGDGEVIREGDEWRDGGNSGTGAWNTTSRIGEIVRGSCIGDYRRKEGAK